jgi:uncharacterized protein YjeT (DUF2065 family)
MPKSRTHLSLFYVVTYLTISGLGLTLAPQWTLRLLFSNGHYESTALRFAGIFILGLGAIVTQVIRFRLDVLYPTLIGVRVFFCAAYVVLYATTGDPFFLSVLGVVGLGLAMSSLSFALDRRARAAGAPLSAKER